MPVLGLGAKARDQAAGRASMHDQRLFEQVVGAQEIGLVAQVAQHGDGFRMVGLGLRSTSHSEAPRGRGWREAEQRILGPAADGRAQTAASDRSSSGSDEKAHQRESGPLDRERFLP